MNKTKKRAAKRSVIERRNFLLKWISSYENYVAKLPKGHNDPLANAESYRNIRADVLSDMYPAVSTVEASDDPQLTFVEFQYFYPKKSGKEYQNLLIDGKLPRYAFDMEEYNEWKVSQPA